MLSKSRRSLKGAWKQNELIEEEEYNVHSLGFVSIWSSYDLFTRGWLGPVRNVRLKQAIVLILGRHACSSQCGVIQLAPSGLQPEPASLHLKTVYRRDKAVDQPMSLGLSLTGASICGAELDRTKPYGRAVRLGDWAGRGKRRSPL